MLEKVYEDENSLLNKKLIVSKDTLNPDHNVLENSKNNSDILQNEDLTKSLLRRKITRVSTNETAKFCDVAENSTDSRKNSFAFINGVKCHSSLEINNSSSIPGSTYKNSVPIITSNISSNKTLIHNTLHHSRTSSGNIDVAEKETDSRKNSFAFINGVKCLSSEITSSIPGSTNKNSGPIITSYISSNKTLNFHNTLHHSRTSSGNITNQTPILETQIEKTCELIKYDKNTQDKLQTQIDLMKVILEKEISSKSETLRYLSSTKEKNLQKKGAMLKKISDLKSMVTDYWERESNDHIEFIDKIFDENDKNIEGIIENCEKDINEEYKIRLQLNNDNSKTVAELENISKFLMQQGQNTLSELNNNNESNIMGAQNIQVEKCSDFDDMLNECKYKFLGSSKHITPMKLEVSKSVIQEYEKLEIPIPDILPKFDNKPKSKEQKRFLLPKRSTSNIHEEEASPSSSLKKQFDKIKEIENVIRQNYNVREKSNSEQKIKKRNPSPLDNNKGKQIMTKLRRSINISKSSLQADNQTPEIVIQNDVEEKFDANSRFTNFVKKSKQKLHIMTKSMHSNLTSFDNNSKHRKKSSFSGKHSSSHQKSITKDEMFNTQDFSTKKKLFINVIPNTDKFTKNSHELFTKVSKTVESFERDSPQNPKQKKISVSSRENFMNNFNNFKSSNYLFKDNTHYKSANEMLNIESSLYVSNNDLRYKDAMLNTENSTDNLFSKLRKSVPRKTDESSLICNPNTYSTPKGLHGSFSHVTPKKSNIEHLKTEEYGNSKKDKGDIFNLWMTFSNTKSKANDQSDFDWQSKKMKSQTLSKKVFSERSKTDSSKVGCYYNTRYTMSPKIDSVQMNKEIRNFSKKSRGLIDNISHLRHKNNDFF